MVNQNVDNFNDNDVIITTDEFGTVRYTKNGELHRLDGPALIKLNGTMKYYQNDELHRIGGPAVIKHDKLMYYQHDELHIDPLNNVQRPTVIYSNGSVDYHWHNKLHRLDGPAIIKINRVVEYYQNGERHRDLINSVQQPTVIYSDGDLEYHWHNDLHRLDGPAVTRFNKAMWYQFDKLHRNPIDNVQQPTIVYSDGTLEYHQYGKWHRVGGPALCYSDGRNQWALNGKIYISNVEAGKHIEPSAEEVDKMVIPWYIGARFHRNDSPAVIYHTNI